MRAYFKNIQIGATIKTPCGQTYRKRSARTLEMAPGHSHYSEPPKWFYASYMEVFEVVKEASDA